jgi:quinoprotein glucose dehydrogenase
MRALVQYVISGDSRDVGPAAPSPFDLKYRFTGYKSFSTPKDVRPRPRRGTLNAINLNTGEYAWKIRWESIPSWSHAG